MAATTISTTMAMLNAKCLTTTTTTTTTNSPKTLNPSKPTPKPISLLSRQTLPKALTTSSNPSLAGTALAGAIFSTLSSTNPAMAAQQIAEIAEGDNRGLALLLPIIPAIAWVLFNILQPALNQLNKMRNSKGVIIGLGLGGGLGLAMSMTAPQASANEIAMVAEAASDNRGQLLLFVIAPAILWVLYNILQPALNQLNRMRS